MADNVVSTPTSDASPASTETMPADATGLRSWSLIRLKSTKAGSAVTSADDFLRDLQHSRFIQEASITGATLRLYGYSTAGNKPTFASFLEVFDQLHLPLVPTYAYVMIVRLDDATAPWYAMPFGHGGKSLLVEDCIDADAARQITVRLSTPRDRSKSPKIRQLGTTQMGSRPMRVQKRATGDASLEDFGSDKYGEILNDIDARPDDREKYGSSVRGGDGIGLSKRIAIGDLPDNIAMFENVHSDDSAGADAEDWMHPVKDPPLERQLDELLVAAVRDPNNHSVTFSIPDFIYADEWATLKLTQLGRTPPLTDDLDIDTYRLLLRDAGRLDGMDVDYLKRAQAIVGDEKKTTFRVFNCLSAEIHLDNRTFVHDNRDWYEIPSGTVAYIDRQVDDIKQWNGGLEQPASRIDEPTFNKNADPDRFLYMDRENASVERGQWPLEICDLLCIDSDAMLALVHVKRDFKSSMLSHLFAQGRASAIMLLETGPRQRFRDKMMSALAKSSPKPSWSRRLRGFISDEGFNPRKTRVVYAILAPWKGRPPSKALPFMSKLNLSNAARDLRGRQFDIRIACVEMAGERKKPRKKALLAPANGAVAAQKHPPPFRASSRVP